MFRVVGLVALVVFAVFCAGTFISMQRRDSRLDVARNEVDEQRILFESPVQAKVKVGNGVIFKPIRARTRLLIRESSLQIVPDDRRRNKLLGSEVIIQIDGSKMSIQRVAFPIVKRTGIVISGLQLDEPIGLALYSKNGIDRVWSALEKAGVSAVRKS